MHDTQSQIPLWRKEYEQKGIPSSFKEEPSSSVVNFVSFLREETQVSHGVALDLGCGTGRNSIYLAEQGFEVFSIDFVPEMVVSLRSRSEALGLASRIHPYCQSVTEPWRFSSHKFDIAIDAFCYKHQVTSSGKGVYRHELARVLQPGGFYMLTLAGIDDGYYGPLLTTSPNPNEHMIVDPANGIPSLLYSREEIEQEFSHSFALVRYMHKKRDGTMHGEVYSRSTHVFFFTRRVDTPLLAEKGG